MKSHSCVKTNDHYYRVIVTFDYIIANKLLAIDWNAR